jgi:nicotinamidase-related amidase
MLKSGKAPATVAESVSTSATIGHICETKPYVIRDTLKRAGNIAGESHEREVEMEFAAQDTALVITDPQNDFLSPEGVTWGLVGASVEENQTVEHIEQLLIAAKEGGYEVFISPHYYYPTDHEWKFGGTVEAMMHEIHMFDRDGALSLEGFRGSGADWLERFKPYIEDGKTIVVSPHKVYGPESNDLVLQLRKRGITKIALAGMSANLCVEAHLRELLEQGFEVAVVKDATAAAQHPELGDGYATALTNFGFIANAVITTDEAAAALRTGATVAV